MLKRFKIYALLSFLLIGFLLPSVTKAYYVDGTQNIIRLKPSEIMFFTILKDMNGDINFISDTGSVIYNYTVKDAGEFYKTQRSGQTSSTQNANLLANEELIISNKSSENFLYINMNNFVLNTDYKYKHPAIQEGTYTYTPAQALSTGTTEIQGGALSMTVSNSQFSFPMVTLDGTAKTISASLPNVNIMDGTGTGSGWRAIVSAPNGFKEVTPTDGFKLGTSAKTFTSESFTIKPSSIVGLNGSNISGITLSSTRQNLKSNDVVLASAAVGSGMGQYDLTFGPDALQLEILNNKAYVDKVNFPETGTPYSVTLRWSIISGP